MFGEHQAGIEHREQVVAANGVGIVGLGKLAHTIFAVRRIDINDIHCTAVLNKQVLQRLIVVANNQFVGGFTVVGMETQGCIATEIGNVVRHPLKTLVEMQARAFVSCTESGNRDSLVLVVGLADEFAQQVGIGRFEDAVFYTLIYLLNEILLETVQIGLFHIG